MIVPGGGISLDGSRWVSCRPRRFLPVRVFSKLFRGLMLAKLLAAHKAGQLQFFNQYAHLAEPKPFARYLAPLRRRKWYVYSKRPFGGPEAVLAYLSRYTHRVAISNRRLIALDENGVTFNYKDYRADGQARHKVMTLATNEFIRRFLSHVLPKGFHRIRYYGLLAKSSCAENLGERASCLQCQNRKTSLIIPAALMRQKPAHIPVHAAAAACASSRPSRPAASRSTDLRRQPSPSESTPHDHRH